jgi:hypothetical protein
MIRALRTAFVSSLRRDGRILDQLSLVIKDGATVEYDVLVIGSLRDALLRLAQRLFRQAIAEVCKALLAVEVSEASAETLFEPRVRHRIDGLFECGGISVVEPREAFTELLSVFRTLFGSKQPRRGELLSQQLCDEGLCGREGKMIVRCHVKSFWTGLSDVYLYYRPAGPESCSVSDSRLPLPEGQCNCLIVLKNQR